MKKVLVVIDMQNDFIDGSLGSDDCLATVGPVIREIESKEYDYIVLTRDTHQPNYMETLEGKNLPVEHCIREGYGWQIREDIMKAVMDSGKEYKIFDKKSFGSFALVGELETYKDVIEDITIVGLCTDICVVSNALMLRSMLNDTPIWYVADATAGVSRESKEAAIKTMNACQVYEKAR
ncbi:MAG: cysteine hydrolase [Erysipelotrichaceae bacterium]|nr:cysteine hydrolase [Erysipelotrichaceae bacterium]